MHVFTITKFDSPQNYSNLLPAFPDPHQDTETAINSLIAIFCFTDDR